MTLTQAAILTKQFILLFIIITTVGILAFFGYQFWHAYYLSHLPPVEEKADTKFGILPSPIFPVSNVSSTNFTYSLDTSTGSLPKNGQDPNFPKIIKVYFVTKLSATLLSSEKSQDLARKFGIDSPPEILSDTEYKFVQEDETLDVNLDSGNFLYKKAASISAEEKLDDDKQLIDGFTRTLASLDALKDDLSDGRKTVKLFKTSGQDLIPTQVKTEADTAQVSIWPKDLDGRLIMTPEFNKSLVNSTIRHSSNDLNNYLSLEFIYWPIETTTFATYPLKDPSTAFDNLRSGKGVIIIEPSKAQVSITSIYMSYYLSKEYNPYLQPIYVFEGPQFVAYVSAIDNTFIKE